MHQGRLLPLQITALNPANLGSADCTQIGYADDGLPYAIKTTHENGGPYVPLSEWTCSNLARECGIPVPPFDIVQLPENEFAFGSRWEGGILGQDELLKVFSGQHEMPNLQQVLAKIYAFDIFVANIDRHAKNYMLRAGYGDQPVLLAPDYSRALLVNAWPPPITLPTGCNTENTYRHLAHAHDETSKIYAAHELLRKLQLLPGDALDSFLRDIPPEWDPDNRIPALIQWWKNDRIEHIEHMQDGIDNGLYPSLRNP